MKEQLAAMTIIELVRTGHSYATSIQQIDTYSAIVTELAARLEALNLAHIGGMNSLRSAISERDQLAAENAARKSAAKKVIKMNRQHAKDKHGNPDIAESWACVKALRQVNTPATDAWQREQMARGVEKFAAVLRRKGDDAFFDAIAEAQANAADQFAAQLRNGEAE